MKFLNLKAIDAASIAGAPVSAAIPAEQLIQVSVQGVVTGSSPVGTLKLQGSNDPILVNYLPKYTPTNWSDIPNATIAVSATGVFLIPKTEICYSWIRVVWVVGSGSGLVTARLVTVGP